MFCVPDDLGSFEKVRRGSCKPQFSLCFRVVEPKNQTVTLTSHLFLKSVCCGICLGVNILQMALWGEFISFFYCSTYSDHKAIT